MVETVSGPIEKIGILMGGPSSEREISLKSGKAVYEALKEIGLDICAIDIKTDDIRENIKLIGSQELGCAFIALHGYFGEDGRIQEILEDLNIPYTGSNSLSSRLSMDKVASRQVLQLSGLAVPNYTVADKISYSPNWKIFRKLKFPLVVKPATGGSSIGLSIIDSENDLDRAVWEAFRFDDQVIIDEYIAGREMTVGILENSALPVVEIIPKKRFFDYEAKYTAGMTEYQVPASLDGETTRILQSAAVKVHHLLGCFGYSRIDMILTPEGRVYVLELNSIPGLTPTSLLPKAAKQAGIDFKQLCLKLINTAYEKRKDRKTDS